MATGRTGGGLCTRSPGAFRVVHPIGSRTALTLVELLVVIAIVAVLVGLLLPSIQAARETARRISCSNNLKQLGLAAHAHHNSMNWLPPGFQSHALTHVDSATAWSGGFGVGWNVFLLPFMEQATVFDGFMNALRTKNPHYVPYTPITRGETRWDQGGNQAYKTIINGVMCPSDMLPSLNPNAGKSDDNWPKSNYFAMAGNDNLRGNWGTLGYDYKGSGMFWPNSQVSFAHVRDGLSNTLMFGEQSDKESSSWCGVRFGGYFHAALKSSRNGWEYQINAPPTTAWTSRHAIRSNHPAGVAFCLADGSVVFISEMIAASLYEGLGTRAGREPGCVPN